MQSGRAKSLERRALGCFDVWKSSLARILVMWKSPLAKAIAMWKSSLAKIPAMWKSCLAKSIVMWKSFLAKIIVMWKSSLAKINVLTKKAEVFNAKKAKAEAKLVLKEIEALKKDTVYCRWIHNVT